MCPVWSRLVFVAPLMLAACPGPEAGETTSSTSNEETSSQTSAEPTNTTEDCQVGMLGCPCTGGGACDPGLECNANKVCEPMQVVTTESETTAPPMTTSTTEATDASTSTGTTESSGPECTQVDDGTLESDECLALYLDRPFCVGDTCKPCGDLAEDACSVATNGVRPICLPAGVCVQCDSLQALEKEQCVASSPHCNLDTHTCEGCFEHSECPESACEIATRTCFPNNKITYIRLAEPCESEIAKGGTETNPYCDYATAIASVQFNGDDKMTFYLLGNDQNVAPGAVTVTKEGPSVSYAFVHEPGAPGDSHTTFAGIGPLLLVGNGVTLYVKEFGFVPKPTSDTSRGVDCQTGGSFWLDDSYVKGARGPGIRSDGCNIHLRRSAVSFGFTEGLDITGGNLHMVNSFIAGNQKVMGLGGGGLRVRGGGAAVDINFSTIVDNSNEGLLGYGDSIHCDDPASVSLKVRNSIIARRPDNANLSIVCDDEAQDFRNNTADHVLKNASNVKRAAEDLLGALSPSMLTGSYRIMGLDEQDEFFDLSGQWEPGDPHFDFDLEPRDISNGMMTNVVGADVILK